MKKSEKAFSLVELSIVLVILGLLVGGVLAGRDLIAAAALRAQMKQFETIEVAVNTFRVKYNGLPGDLRNADRLNLFSWPASKVGGLGFGDGNGIIEGVTGGSWCGDYVPAIAGTRLFAGELHAFWTQLKRANLFDGIEESGCQLSPTTNEQPVPRAKIGTGHVYLWSEGRDHFLATTNFTYMYPGSFQYNSVPNLSVAQAYGMDMKIDDGKPQHGRITARYLRRDSSPKVVWAGTADLSATSANGSTCYDNGGVNGEEHHYSMGDGSGNTSCAVSVKAGF